MGKVLGISANSQDSRFTKRLLHLGMLGAIRIGFTCYFRGIYLHRSSPKPEARAPAVALCPVHTSWWDGFIAYWLNYKLFRRRFLVVMLNSELSKVPFLKAYGAIGITPDSTSSVRRCFKALNEQLSLTPEPLVTLFPQGQLFPSCIEQIHAKEGLRLLETKEELEIWPACWHLEAGRNLRPQIFVMLSPKRLSLAEYKSEPELLEELLNQLRKNTFQAIANDPKSDWKTVWGADYRGYE